MARPIHFYVSYSPTKSNHPKSLTHSYSSSELRSRFRCYNTSWWGGMDRFWWLGCRRSRWRLWDRVRKKCGVAWTWGRGRAGTRSLIIWIARKDFSCRDVKSEPRSEPSARTKFNGVHSDENIKIWNVLPSSGEKKTDYTWCLSFPMKFVLCHLDEEVRLRLSSHACL